MGEVIELGAQPEFWPVCQAEHFMEWVQSDDCPYVYGLTVFDHRDGTSSLVEWDYDQVGVECDSTLVIHDRMNRCDALMRYVAEVKAGYEPTGYIPWLTPGNSRHEKGA